MHQVKIESAPIHHKGEFPQSRAMWNIRKLNEAIALLREQVGIRTKKKETFKVFLDEKLYFDSEQFK